MWRAGWLEEAALFAAIDKEVGTEFWWQWPEDLRDRNEEALAAAREKHKDFVSPALGTSGARHRWTGVSSAAVGSPGCWNLRVAC